jgi:hypothetical protein
MWMVEPSKMCSKHLRGEYVECLMIAGLFKKKRKIDGFLAHNCIEPKSVVSRFASLKAEMLKRGYACKKELKQVDFSYLPQDQQDFRIDKEKNKKLLAERCAECRKLIFGNPDFLMHP